MSQLATQTNLARPGRDDHTDMAVGEILRRTRIHYGQSLNDVEAILRIRAAQLQALEEGRMDLLPGRVYAIGFVRAYAEYLGLDGEKMVHLFKTQSGNPPRPRSELHFPAPASESKLPNYLILAASALGICLVVAGLVYVTGNLAPETRTVPDVPPSLRAEALAQQPPAQLAQATPPVIGPVLPGQSQGIVAGTTVTAPPAPIAAAVTAPVTAPAITAQNDQQEPAAASAPVAAPVTAEQRHELVIRVKETAWVEVRGVDGRALLSRVLKPGDTYTVPPGPGMTLDTGNIGGLEFVLNGQVLPPLGAVGDVRRRVSLDPESLAPQQARSNPAAAAAAINPAAGGE